MNRDGIPIYEAYDSDGNLVSSGTSKEVGETIGLTPNHISKVAKDKMAVKGYEVVRVATIRKVFDCYHKGKFVCSGTYDEITEHTGFNREYVKAASYAATHKRAAKTRESMMLLLFEHDDTKLEWI